MTESPRRSSEERPRERPILFCGEMVCGILEDRKTNTRRVIKPQPPIEAVDAGCLRTSGADDGMWWWLDSKDLLDASPVGNEFRCPYGVVGDRLWVRETFMPWRRTCVEYPHEFDVLNRDERGGLTLNEWIAEYGQNGVEVAYRADGDDEGWMPAIHMPRWASRITLEITEVRVERVQEISEEDAYAEGVTDSWPLRNLPYLSGFGGRAVLNNYAHLWDSINAEREGGIYAWAANPWVWVIEFKRANNARPRQRRKGAA